MALSVFNWQPPDFDGLIRTALAARQADQQAANQALEQQRLQQKQQQDFSLALRQEGRLAIASQQKNDLDLAQEIRQSQNDSVTRDFHVAQTGDLEDKVRSRRESDANMSNLLGAPQPALPTDGASPATAAPAGSELPGSLLDFMKDKEGFKGTAWPSEDGKTYDVGYGTLGKPGETISEEEASRRLEKAITNIGGQVDANARRLGYDLTPNQRAALIDFEYNTGSRGYVFRQMERAKGDVNLLASNTFATGLTTATGGNSMRQGLLNRRNAEKQLFAANNIKAPADMLGQGQPAGAEGVYLPQPNGSYSGAPQTASAAPIFPADVAAMLRALPAQDRADAIQAIATQRMKQNSQGDLETIEEATKSMTFNPVNNTYRRADGSEYFVNKGANGRITMRSFRPADKPAAIKIGDDGQVYAFDAKGDPLKPIPEGVGFDLHKAKPDYRSLPGVGLVMVNGDGSTRVLVPAASKITAKQQDQYRADVTSARESQVEYEAQQKLFAEKGQRGLTNWFGVSKESVDQAKGEMDKARTKLEDWYTQHPELRPSATAAPGGAGALIQPARAPAPAPAAPVAAAPAPGAPPAAPTPAPSAASPAPAPSAPAGPAPAQPAAAAPAPEEIGGTIKDRRFDATNYRTVKKKSGELARLPVLTQAQASKLVMTGVITPFVDANDGKVYEPK